ncbi:MAG: CoB--CoM heterodisulfide reductase iron-sulfur subunit B family protein [Desulfomonilaceae bacterium]
MEVLLYLGCTVPIRNLNYEVSARLTAQALGINFRDLEEFGCCGFPLKSLSVEDTLVTAARNLALAEREGLDICALCNACAGTLNEVAHQVRTDLEMREKINRRLKTIGLHVEGKVKVRNFMRLLWEEIGVEGIRKTVTKPLHGIMLAPHYGCHYLKPSELNVGFDSPENPRTLSDMIEATGATVVNYPSLLDCCGGGLLGVSEEVANAMAARKLIDVSKTGAHALVLVCPFCNVMYEGQQKKISKATGLDLKTPVVYYPQALGLALGMKSEQLGFRLNRIKPTSLLKIVEG